MGAPFYRHWHTGPRRNLRKWVGMATSEDGADEDRPTPGRRDAIDSGARAVPRPVSALSLAARAADAALVLGRPPGEEVAAAAVVRRFQAAVYGLAVSV